MTIAQLRYNHSTGRYHIDGDELHAGDGLSVLICNEDGVVKWIYTRIELSMCDDVWYLMGLPPGIQMDGLWAFKMGEPIFPNVEAASLYLKHLEDIGDTDNDFFRRLKKFLGETHE